MTYLLMNLGFSLVAVLFSAVALRNISWKTLGLVALALFAITAIGDNFIVANGIVDYSLDKISGILVGVAPIEDFFYALIAVILVPAIWLSLGKFSKRGENE